MVVRGSLSDLIIPLIVRRVRVGVGARVLSCKLLCVCLAARTARVIMHCYTDRRYSYFLFCFSLFWN